MKTEDLKQLAEYMGYKVKWTSSHNPEVYLEIETEWSTELINYSPLTNAEQCLELIQKFKMDIEWDKAVCMVDTFSLKNGFSEGASKSLNEAVTNAAIAAIK